MEELAEDFREWCETNGFKSEWDDGIGADELFMIRGNLTAEQRTWLNSFIERWDRQQALVDRLAGLLGLAATTHNGVVVA